MPVQHYNYDLLAVAVKAHSGAGFQTTEQRRERTSTEIYVCAHTYTHTPTRRPLVHLQFMTLWKREGVFQKATSVPWQTHKSFDFSAIKQQSCKNQCDPWVSVHLAKACCAEISLLSSLTRPHSLSVCALQCSSRATPFWIVPLSCPCPCCLQYLCSPLEA